MRLKIYEAVNKRLDGDLIHNILQVSKDAIDVRMDVYLCTCNCR